MTLRVSLIHQNQTRAFNLPLFGNWWQPFHKDMNWNLFESMLLVQAYLPCVKEYGHVSWIPNGSVTPGFKDKAKCTPYVSPRNQISHIATNEGAVSIHNA